MRDATPRRLRVSVRRGAILAALVAALLGATASQASAAYVHNEVTGEYGKEGAKATGLGDGCALAWQGATQRLYLFSNSKIYGLQRVAPGTVSPLSGNFPVTVGTSSNCFFGGPQIAVDNSINSSAGNIYTSGGQTSGFTAAGEALAAPWPLSVGQTCGLAVANNGDVWVAPEGSGSVRRFLSNGGPAATVSPGLGVCTIAIDPSNNDLFVTNSPFGRELFKLTAASGYMTKTQFPNYTPREAGGVPVYPSLAVNGALHRLYIADESSAITVLDTNTGTVIETIIPGPANEEPGGNTVRDVVVDEATDTLFVTVGSGNTAVIKEMPGAFVPKVTTGEPEGNEVRGSVETDGAGPVTGCYFEVGATTSYGLGKESCTPGTPYAGPVQNVSANLAGLSPEHTYHYRLVAANANGHNDGADRTITPHYVENITTDPAEEVTRTTAKLKAHFTGHGEDTKYYFEWGTDTSYGTKSATPPGPTIVNPNGVTQLSFEATGLQPETLYHYRVVAENVQGISIAEDRTFTTLPAVAGLSTLPASNVEPQEADLNASFNGDGLNVEYFFEWGATTSYGLKTPVEERVMPTGLTTISAPISGLQRLHTYHYRIVATNNIGATRGADQSFTTVSAPEIVGLSSSDVALSTANLHAVINPQNAATEYHFEYGPTAAYGTSLPIPDGALAAGTTDDPVEVHLTGLTGGVYHFRIVTTSVFGVTKSDDQTFNFYPPTCPNASVRQQSGSNTLPDCRAYELVTPEDAGVTIVYPASVPFSPDATSPSRLAFGGAWGSVEGVGTPANYLVDTYVATRTSHGWKTRSVAIPSSQAALSGGPPWTYLWQQPSSFTGQYVPDKWLTDVLTNPSMSAIVDWNDGYYPCNVKFCAGYGNGEGFESSNAPYVWDSTTGKQLDRWPTNVGSIPGGESFKGRTAASADLSHFVFTSNIPFAVGGEPGDMYDNDTVHDTVKIASLKNNDEHIAGVAPVELSDDGSHILMTVGGGRRPGGFYMPTDGAGELHMRVDDAVTYEIAPGHAVRYVGMTPDGKKVYFTSNEDLMEDHSDTDTSTDLYMWSEKSTTPNHLTLVSKGNEPSAGNTDACNASWTEKCNIVPISFTSESTGGYSVASAGEGGSPYSDNFIAEENGDIYFLSPEQLHGANGVVGDENLYAYRNGKLQFVAALDPNSETCTPEHESCADTAVARMEVTPNDSHMAFLTASRVAGYDNQGESEMYLYTPSTDELTCVSCRPDGEPPTAPVTTSHNGIFLTNDGRTFFETADPLVPQDTNEARDVYEFTEGRPQLITGGTGAANNTSGVGTNGASPGLIGVSANGTDVYFATYEVLVGQDRNGEALKIYDARSGGGFQFTPAVPPCVAADECHGAGSSAPSSPPSGTGSDLGSSGNVQPTDGKAHRVKQRHKKRHHGKARRRGHRND